MIVIRVCIIIKTSWILTLAYLAFKILNIILLHVAFRNPPMLQGWAMLPAPHPVSLESMDKTHTRSHTHTRSFLTCLLGTMAGHYYLLPGKHALTTLAPLLLPPALTFSWPIESSPC